MEVYKCRGGALLLLTNWAIWHIDTWYLGGFRAEGMHKIRVGLKHLNGMRYRVVVL